MELCSAEVPMRGMNFHRTRSCKNKATVVRDGKHYCKIHDPKKVLERKKKNEEKFKERIETKTKLHYAYLYLKNKNNNEKK